MCTPKQGSQYLWCNSDVIIHTHAWFCPSIAGQCTLLLIITVDVLKKAIVTFNIIRAAVYELFQTWQAKLGIISCRIKMIAGIVAEVVEHAFYFLLMLDGPGAGVTFVQHVSVCMYKICNLTFKFKHKTAELCTMWLQHRDGGWQVLKLVWLLLLGSTSWRLLEERRCCLQMYQPM